MSYSRGIGWSWSARMRPDRTTPRIVALFRERWPGGLLPKSLILREVRERGPPISERGFEYALARAVDQRHLRIVKSRDGGALYCLASYGDANPAVLESLRTAPLRSLQWKDERLQARAVRRYLDAGARKGGHDYRPGHKCVTCGYRTCLFLSLQNPTKEQFLAVVREVERIGAFRSRKSREKTRK